MSKNTKRSALFGILSIVLWCLMVIPMLVLIVPENLFSDGVSSVICFGAIIPNIAGLVLGILGFVVCRRGFVTWWTQGSRGPRLSSVMPMSPVWGVALNVFLSWPVFAIWHSMASLSGIFT